MSLHNQLTAVKRSPLILQPGPLLFPKSPQSPWIWGGEAGQESLECLLRFSRKDWIATALQPGTEERDRDGRNWQGETETATSTHLTSCDTTHTIQLCKHFPLTETVDEWKQWQKYMTSSEGNSHRNVLFYCSVADFRTEATRFYAWHKYGYSAIYF